MKLRNKLAAVLSTAMVVTSIPVVTMASSTNAISVYNYNIKDTTIGFQTTSTVIKADATTAAGIQVFTGSANAGVFNPAYVPGIEIKPDSTYDLGGTVAAPAQSAFIHLTKDSSFQVEALMFYVDALYNGNKTTAMYFNADGKVENANNTAWNNKTKEEILAMPQALTVYMGTSAARAVTDTGMTFTVIDSNKLTENDRTFESTIRVDLFGKFDKNTTYKIPFLVKVGGDKEVLVKIDGRDSFISSNLYTLTGELTDKRITVSAESNKITVDGTEEIGKIKISETAIDSLQKDGATNRKIKITLPSSSDLEFNLTKTEETITATGKRGFYGKPEQKGSAISVAYGTTSRNAVEDRRVLIVELPNWTDATAKGEIELSGIFVRPTERLASTGEVNVTIEEYVAANAVNTKLVEKTSVKVAEVTNYDVTLGVKDGKVASVKAGRSGVVNNTEVTFVLEESVKDSLVDGRKIEFVLENGYIFGAADIDLTGLNSSYTSNEYEQRALKTFEDLIEEKKIKFEEKAEKVDLSSLQLEINQDGQVIGFTAEYPELSPEKADKLQITIPVATNVQATGEVKLKANNLFTRTSTEDKECVIANVVPPIEVAVETAQIKVGLQAQEAGSITIKETDKGMLERGWLFLAADVQKGITFDELPTIEVKGEDGKVLEIKNATLSKDKTMIGFEVARTSTEASTIEIKNIKFTADRTVPEADYDLVMWGTALTDENVVGINNFTQNALNANKYFNQTTDQYVVESFIKMTTKNTEDITDAAKAVTTNFEIGSTEFVVNGEKHTMTVAPYIKDNYTFVPVKYLAQAFGITGDSVQYDKATSTATIIAGSKVVSITNGNAHIVVNGTQVPMATKAEIKDGRMCVPMSYIAAALGIDKSWDPTTKTATFTNVAQ